MRADTTPMRKHIVPDAGVASRACKLQFPDAQVGLVPIVAIMLVAGALGCSEHPMGHMALSSSKLRFRAGLVSSLFDFFVDTNSCKHKVPHALLNNKLLVTNALLNNKLLVPHALLRENVGNTTLQTKLSMIGSRGFTFHLSLNST